MEFQNRPEIGQILQAQWLHTLLSSTYGRHNLSSSKAQILDDIRKKRVIPVFDFDGNKLLRGAAMIMGEKTIEIGRCANMSGANGGGKLMLELVDVWEKDTQELCPLVAEVRMASPFEGIAGGQGSQATLLGKAGFIPHALLPSFHHPGPKGPDRQELFCFSTKEKEKVSRQAPREITIPNDPSMNPELLKTLLHINGFETKIQFDRFEGGKVLVKQLAKVPFSLFEVDWQTGNQIEDVPKNRGEENPFDLVVVSSADEELGETAQGLIDNGFQCIGITAPHEGHLRLMFGRLGKCVFAPTEVMRNFPHISEDLIMQVDSRFRNQATDINNMPQFWGIVGRYGL